MAATLHFNDAPSYLKVLIGLNTANTPFIQAAAGNGIAYANAIDFDMGQIWDVGAGSQTGLSEDDVVAGAAATSVGRTLEQNTIQLFQKKVQVSYLREAATSGLTGFAADGSSISPEAFQIQAHLAKINKDWGFGALRGARTAAAGGSSATDLAMGGIIPAAVAAGNVVDATNTALSKTLVNSLLVKLADGGAAFARPTIVVGAKQKVALSSAYGLAPTRDSIGGVAVDVVVTDFGFMPVIVDQNMANDQLLVVDMAEVRPVVLPVKGTDILVEELSKSGASSTQQIYAQLSIDFGSGKLHGVLDNLA